LTGDGIVEGLVLIGLTVMGCLHASRGWWSAAILDLSFSVPAVIGILIGVGYVK